jgi:hypothetical protein
MCTVLEMRDRFQLFLLNVEVHAMDIINASEKNLVELVQEQLYHGEDGKGFKIRPSYASAEYARLKSSRNPLPGMWTPDLHNTGSFYNQMRIWWLGTSQFSIISEDKKFRDLMIKYGVDITKLQEESIQFFRINRFNPLFIDLLCTLTGAQKN